MKLRITFKQINSEFSQEAADIYQFGKESENNQKYHWAKSFLVNSDIDKISIDENQNLHFIDELNYDEKLELFIENVTILSCYKNNTLFSQYAVSSEFIEKTHDVFKKKENTRYCYFYLKDKKEFVELENHIFILEKDIKKIPNKN